MTINAMGQGLTLQNVKFKASAPSPELQERMKDAMRALSKPQMDPALADNHPSKIYATVEVNGKTVATIYNSGSAGSSNADYGRIKDLPSMGETETLLGPALAKKRAQEIAKALGGTVEPAPGAQTQSQWMASVQERDAKLAALQAAWDAGAKTKTDAQMIAQDQMDMTAFYATTAEGTPEAEGDISDAIDSSPAKQFMEFMQGARENPGGFFRAQYLASKGLTEEDVANMAPEDRLKLEEEIKALIKQAVEKQQKEAAAGGSSLDSARGDSPQITAEAQSGFAPAMAQDITKLPVMDEGEKKEEERAA